MAVFDMDVQKIAARISEAYAPEKIILFGSLASGSSQANDIDLLIIKKTDQKPWQRSREVNSLVEHTIPMDLLVYTPEEIRQRVAIRDFFILDILENGKVLYEQRI